ncbi:hypothetical protein S245_029444, partial [Arachis hypogaea]
EALMTLCPKNWVGDNVLNLMASILMKHAAVIVEGNKWFLPTTFAISFLENLLLDYWFYQLDNTKRPMVSKFKFQEPEVPQQDAQSNDCGVWVAQWQTLSSMAAWCHTS